MSKDEDDWRGWAHGKYDGRYEGVRNPSGYPNRNPPYYLHKTPRRLYKSTDPDVRPQ